jgi:hypothetical protein
VLAAVRDLIRAALKLARYVNTAAGRRAHTERHRVLDLWPDSSQPFLGGFARWH